MIVHAIVDAGGTLVAPDHGIVLQSVGKRAVEQLHKFVPFQGVVKAGVEVFKRHCIMHDVLQDKE